MLTSSRGMRFVWLLGLFLLLGSVLGAGWVLHQPASGTGPSSTDGNLLGVVGNGFVDIEEGLTFLHPAQPGRVASVWVKEGDEVHEGDLLLSMDNQVAKKQLDEAQGALDIAQIKLQEAQDKLPKKWQIAIEKQKLALAGAKSKLAAAESTLKMQQELHKNRQISDDQLAVYQHEAKWLEAQMKGHEQALTELTDLGDPAALIEQARADVKVKQAKRDQAHVAFVECDVYAPAAGVILRLFATPGDALTSQPRQPAVQFCPHSPRIVRAEILQEWANKVAVGQVALIEDDTRAGTQWKGKVARVSGWFTHRRAILLEPFQYNDVRTLECIIELEPGGPPVRIGQRVRATIKQ